MTAPAHNEIFVLDLVREDGSRFVTAAGSNQGIREARSRHKAVSGQVAHWKRDKPVYDFLEGFRCTWNDWRLAERFAL